MKLLDNYCGGACAIMKLSTKYLKIMKIVIFRLLSDNFGQWG